MSARTGDGVDALVDHLVARLPEGPQYYPDDMVTDVPEAFWVAELVREQLLRRTHDELPHSIAARVTEWEWPCIRCEILVERDSQKGIVIGKKGQVLKEVGIAVREQLPEGAYLELLREGRQGLAAPPEGHGAPRLLRIPGRAGVVRPARHDDRGLRPLPGHDVGGGQRVPDPDRRALREPDAQPDDLIAGDDAGELEAALGIGGTRDRLVDRGGADADAVHRITVGVDDLAVHAAGFDQRDVAVARLPGPKVLARADVVVTHPNSASVSGQAVNSHVVSAVPDWSVR